MFHVFVHPNPGQPIPKWWAYGLHGVGQWVCWGKLGQTNGKADPTGAGPARHHEKQSEGYLLLGAFQLTEGELDSAMLQTRDIWHGKAVMPRSPEERRLLESFCREIGKSFSLILGAPAAAQASSASTPGEKAKKHKPLKKTKISDLSESWF